MAATAAVDMEQEVAHPLPDLWTCKLGNKPMVTKSNRTNSVFFVLHLHPVQNTSRGVSPQFLILWSKQVTKTFSCSLLNFLVRFTNI